MPSLTERGPRITIKLCETDAFVHSADAAAVRPHLQTQRIVFDSGPHGILGTKRTELLARSTSDGGLRIAAKVSLGVARRLRANNGNVSLEVPRGYRMARLDRGRLCAMSKPTQFLFEDRESERGAMIRFERQTHPFRMVLEVLWCYPQTRAVVAVKNRDHIRTWIERLSNAELGRPVVDARHWAGGSNATVVVTSLQLLDHCRPEDFDLAIVPDARPLRSVDGLPIDFRNMHPQIDYRLLRHWYIPAFGFIPEAFGLKPGEECRMGSLFGNTVSL